MAPRESLPAIDPLSPNDWDLLARRVGLIPDNGHLRPLQIECSNIIVSGGGDPSNHGKGVSSIFLCSEQNSAADFALAANGDMMVIYACIEMIESPSFARLLHADEWCSRLSAVYIDESHLVHESHTWRPAYSRIHRLRAISGPRDSPNSTRGDYLQQFFLVDYKAKTASTRGLWDRVDHDLAERREKTMEHPAETRAALSSVVFEESLKAHIKANPLKKKGKPKAGKQMPDWQKIIARSVEEMDKYTLEELAGEEPDSDHESHENQLDSLSSLGSASTGPN
ncbi:hypothetical protein B0H14DRAFT_3714979 [Mycena olivaceomarginata]|nr:hypothetical protein B0H14DRAFT_3714979 [Mycena olivaceomarginata]